MSDNAAQEALLPSDYLDWGYTIVETFARGDILDVLHGLIFSQEPVNEDEIEARKIMLNAMEIEMGEGNQMVLDDDNIIPIAAISLNYAMLSKMNFEMPLFVNQVRENIQVSWVSDTTFAIMGFDFINALDTDTLKDLYNCSRTMDGYALIYAEDLLELIRCYAEDQDITLAVGEFIYYLKDSSMLSDYSLVDTDFVGNGLDDLSNEVLYSMFVSQRLDMLSYNTLKKGLVKP